MKKLLLVLSVILFFGHQEMNAQAFSAKDFNIDLGYVIGSHHGAFYSPGVMLSAEKGVHKWIGVGAYAGIQYNLPTYLIFISVGEEHLSVPVGASGSFHFYQMISDLVGKEMGSDKLDLSIKHALGVRFDFESSLRPRFDWGTSVRARYYLKDKLGLYLEVGNPAMGNVVFGLTVKM